jgi:hypothetical protein
MCSPPARLLIETLLVALDAIPTEMVQAIVVANRLYDVRCLSVTAFAAICFSVLSWCH